MRSSVQDLESSLRRRESDISSKSGSYLICKKKANKMISKCFSSSKKSKINKSIDTPAIVGLMRDVEEVSITVFESIFSPICPSRSHPSAADVQEHLCRLRSSDAPSTSSQCNKLSGLKDLYNCLDDFLQSPIMHSSDSEEVLGASIRLLDLCNLTKDAFSQMRASVQDLESSLRRREADVSSKVERYMICMKRVKKMVSKSLAGFKKSQNKKCKETSGTVSLLREVEEVSIKIFESLFFSVFPAKEASKQSRWSLVFKSTQSKRVHEVSEQNYLMALDTNMQCWEEDLECLFRSLIKTRVSILNVLNQC